MIFPTITIEVAREALGKLRVCEPWNGSSFVRWVGQGNKFDEHRAAALFIRIESLRKSFDLNPLPTNRGKDFEAPASEMVHSDLGLEADATTTREFWLWLTFVASAGRFAKVVDWRFGAKPPIEDVNYGVGRKSEIWEGLFARLWLRGNIGLDPSAPDPYNIAKRGGIDIWRSHIIRQEYGRCSSVAKALVRYQHPDYDPASSTLKVKELRELAKRLRIIDASFSYELLGEAEIKELIEENVEIVKSKPGGAVSEFAAE